MPAAGSMGLLIIHDPGDYAAPMQRVWQSRCYLVVGYKCACGTVRYIAPSVQRTAEARVVTSSCMVDNIAPNHVLFLSESRAASLLEDGAMY